MWWEFLLMYFSVFLDEAEKEEKQDFSPTKHNEY